MDFYLILILIFLNQNKLEKKKESYFHLDHVKEKINLFHKA